ncbi:glycosyltransferase family 2 protein [Thermoanaerobacterium thermosaccharolyticum]|uniref:glycosyltransferase family 2 protein n=1 Tax=Thermoanaerobacterium thermosaccharolyticum TaxID=1517 RepID=UPI0020A3F091|nr:glycosyltransferase family 2 protein [Thermoanaerobacterium thermosaccharolyticum]MCP2241251.1 glycosyltransferase involved in cell wall biosynthesis [Thermoanaerobacterium thermosaccharolyticum]
MKFSLILCTIGRDKEVEDFLLSLTNQSYKNYELIIVDQNKDNRVKNIIELYKDKLTNILYFKVDFKGLSRARNFGLLHTSGDIIAFPDDDCKYPENILLEVKNRFLLDKVDFLSCISIDEILKVQSNGRWEKRKIVINKNVLLRTCISYTIFVKSYSLVNGNIKFDERLGVGADTSFQSAEETDFIYQLLITGNKGIYYPELYIYHPLKVRQYNDETINRAYYYAMGLGAFFKKNFKDKTLLAEFLKLLVRPFGGIVYSIFKLNLGGAKFYYKVLSGRCKGFFTFKNQI